MLTTILLLVLWLLIILHLMGCFQAACKAIRYRDVVVNLDADRIAHQPFQPRISLVVRCDLAVTEGAISKIQANLALNYSQYEVVMIIDPERDPESFARILSFFEMHPVAVPAALEGLRFPVRSYYRSQSPLYKRLRIIVKPFRADEDLRYTASAASGGRYMLFVRSLDNEIIRNGLANLAIMKMRRTQDHITPIRGVARYDCSGTFLGTFFKIMADLCNLRRVFVAGSFKGNDYGQFVILRDTSGKKGREEYIPKPQVFLHRPNHFRTYSRQLAPQTFYTGAVGKLMSLMEFLISVVFWGAGLHILFTPGVNEDFIFMLTALLFPLLASTFSVFIAEIFLKENYKIGFVVRLLLVSFVEALVFCILQPWMWLANLFVRVCRAMRTFAARHKRSALHKKAGRARSN